MLNLPEHHLKIMVVGGGGREHALAWKIAQSPLVEKIYCAPGNGGTAFENKTENVEIQTNEFEKLSSFCKEEKIDLTIIGPDNALAEGIVDYFLAKGLRVFGPTKEASKLEWSKNFAKEFMFKWHIPTARFTSCNDYVQACDIVENTEWARVVKVDGLALGKGVYVCNDKTEALSALKEIFQDNKFGTAGQRIVLEEKLEGEEISLFLLCDGKTFLPLAASQDNKRRFENDKGPNTGGMGAISPPLVYEKYKNLIEKTIITPLMTGLKESALDYRGLLYLGILLNRNKMTGTIEPKVLEFNARFGDPETQAVLLRLKSDLLPALWACTEEKLHEVKLSWTDEPACCVIAVTKSYPEKSSKDELITLPSRNMINDNVVIFHAGTKVNQNKLLTAGGRILAISSLGNSLEEACTHTYDCLKKINFSSIDYRKDIGQKSTARII